MGISYSKGVSQHPPQRKGQKAQYFKMHHQNYQQEHHYRQWLDLPKEIVPLVGS